MPYYSRYRRRSGYSRYRRRYSVARRRYRRRSTTSGSVSGRSRIRIRVQCSRIVAVPIAAKSADSSVVTSVPWYGRDGSDPTYPYQACCGAASQPLYQAYTNLYDQVKCDGVVSRISLVTAIGGAPPFSSVQIITAYDRMGTRAEVYGDDAAKNNNVVDLLNYSSAVTRTAINNSVAKTARSCWASDIQERTVFHDCSVNPINQGDKVVGFQDRDYVSTSTKVGYFTPMLLLGFRLSSPVGDAAQLINVLLEQTYYFTFRNPKYGVSGGTVSGASAAAARSTVMAEPADTRTLDTEGEMIFDPPQALVDATVRAADATGSLVRTHGRSGLTPQAKKARLLDEAARYDRESEEWQKRYDDHDAQVAERVGAKDWTRYPKSDRDLLQKFHNESSNKARAAERLREEVYDLDREEALSHTDTLPLDEQI